MSFKLFVNSGIVEFTHGLIRCHRFERSNRDCCVVPCTAGHKYVAYLTDLTEQVQFNAGMYRYVCPSIPCM